jgi:hypothetical protein
MLIMTMSPTSLAFGASWTDIKQIDLREQADLQERADATEQADSDAQNVSDEQADLDERVDACRPILVNPPCLYPTQIPAEPTQVPAEPTQMPPPPAEPTQAPPSAEPTQTPPSPDDPIVEVGSVFGRPGDVVYVDISIFGNTGFAGFAMELEYDALMLEPLSISDGAIVSGVESNLREGGNINGSMRTSWVSMVDPTNTIGDGVLYTIGFKIKEGAAGELPLTPIKTEFFDEILDDMFVYTEPGLITIEDFIYGDINGDSLVDIRDLILINQILSGWVLDLTPAQFQAADVFTDGALDTRDAILLKQYQAGWGGVLLGPGFRVTADSTGGGGQIKVSVFLKNNPGIAGLNFKLNFDSDKVTPVSLTKGSVFSDAITNIDDGQDIGSLSYVSAAWASPNDIWDDGLIMTVTFQTKPGAAGAFADFTIQYASGDIINQKTDDVILQTLNAIHIALP